MRGYEMLVREFGLPIELIEPPTFAICSYTYYRSSDPPDPLLLNSFYLGDLALARRKRGISTEDMAARLFVSRDTLWRLERGDPSVSLGTLAAASFVLQLHERIAKLAAPATDALALELDEQRLPQRIRRPRK